MPDKWSVRISYHLRYEAAPKGRFRKRKSSKKQTNMKKILSTILALAACTTLTAQDFKITHGPWLCDLTSDGVTVVWATSKPALSWVEVAEDDGRSFYAAEHERRYETVAGRKQARKTLHSIRLKGLRPDTKYRYRIFSLVCNVDETPSNKPDTS